MLTLRPSKFKERFEMAGKPCYLFALLHLVPLLFSAFAAKTPPQKTTGYDEEKQTLLRVKAEWGISLFLDSWNDTPTVHHCNWTGIQCSAAGHVTGITINENLNQPIPAAVCDLKHLSHLDVSYNLLPGPFPTILYKCSSLAYLDLSDNYLAGALPDDIHRLSPRLAYFALSANSFSGDIPASISRLSSLQ